MTGTATIALAADVVALIVVGVSPSGSAAVVSLVLLAFTAVAVAMALAEVWRARAGLLARQRPVIDEPDLIDDLGTIAGSFGAQGIATRVSRWVETSPLSPRRHRLLVGVLGAGVAGLGAILWHAFREGAWASPIAAAVFGGLIALGVIGAYLVESRAPPPHPVVRGQLANELTARAMTSPTIVNEISACDAIATFVQWTIGIVSVGLNAFAVVKATYR